MKAVQRKKTKLGQNFLRDPNAARKIVEALGDVSQASVIEIGPGKGALTEVLAASARRLIAIELDRTLSAQLRMEYARHPNVEIVEGDVLQVNFANLIARKPAPLLVASLHAVGEEHERARVVGNVPYYITSPILLRLMESHEWLDTIVLMVQKEVADRIAARPGTRDYGVLSATVQLFTKVEKLFTLPPGAFSPPPKVHSSVLCLKVAPRMQELGLEANPFLDFLKTAFAQKRKTLVNNLKPRYGQPEIATVLKAAHIPAAARAEALSLEQMARIYKSLEPTRPSP